MILQACKSCDRQYDVSHLEPGDRVRCVCEKLLTVEDPTQLTVRAKKCSNCGGRIEPEAERCSYCQSELSEVDLTSTLCPKCFKRIEDDANHCPGCGIAIAPQALTALPDGRKCPRCDGEFRVRSLGAASVVECTACEGLWVKRDEFEAICSRAQSQPEVNLGGRRLEESVSSSEPERKVFYSACPTCGQEMLRKMFRYKNLPSRVVIDYCRQHGVWFDHEELERIVAFIRSRVDSALPFDMEAALGTKRRQPTPIPVGSDWLDSDAIATYFVLDSLGGVLGGLLGSLFD